MSERQLDFIIQKVFGILLIIGSIFLALFIDELCSGNIVGFAAFVAAPLLISKEAMLRPQRYYEITDKYHNNRKRP